VRVSSGSWSTFMTPRPDWQGQPSSLRCHCISLEDVEGDHAGMATNMPMAVAMRVGDAAHHVAHAARATGGGHVGRGSPQFLESRNHAEHSANRPTKGALLPRVPRNMSPLSKLLRRWRIPSARSPAGNRDRRRSTPGRHAELPPRPPHLLQLTLGASHIPGAQSLGQSIAGRNHVQTPLREIPPALDHDADRSTRTARAERREPRQPGLGNEYQFVISSMGHLSF